MPGLHSWTEMPPEELGCGADISSSKATRPGRVRHWTPVFSKLVRSRGRMDMGRKLRQGHKDQCPHAVAGSLHLFSATGHTEATKGGDPGPREASRASGRVSALDRAELLGLTPFPANSVEFK